MNDSFASHNHIRLLRIFAVAVAVALIFVLLAEIQAQVINRELYWGDQDAYLVYAKEMSLTNYQYIGGRNRMPVYPFLISLFYHETLTDLQFFELGKQINIVITLLVVFVVFLIFQKYVHSLGALTVSLMIAFTVFLPRASYLQVENLFYGLNFILFVLLLELMTSPRSRVAVAVGLAGGIAHLTKASVLPAIGLGIVCLALGAIWHFVSDSPRQTLSKFDLSPLRFIAMAVIVMITFLAVVFPYIRTSRAIFGQYFYNVNSTFYLWYDSWEDAKRGTRAYGDRVGWPDMPADEVPGAGKYWRDHTIPQIIGRFMVGGIVVVYFLVFRSNGYSTFMLLYLIFLGVLVWQNRRQLIPPFFHSRLRLLRFFIGSYFASYILLNVWWYYMVMAIANSRFILILALPFTFIVVRLLSSIQARDLSGRIFGQTIDVQTIHRLMLLILFVYLITIYPALIIEQSKVRLYHNADRISRKVTMPLPPGGYW